MSAEEVRLISTRIAQSYRRQMLQITADQARRAAQAKWQFCSLGYTNLAWSVGALALAFAQRNWGWLVTVGLNGMCGIWFIREGRKWERTWLAARQTTLETMEAGIKILLE